MAAVTGALWKLSMSEDNVKCFQELELVPVLIGLLKDNSEGLDDLQFNQGKIQVIPWRYSASKSSIRRFVNTEKAPTRAFSWLKAATTAFTFKTLC